jgi:hypothetical protein
MGRILLGRFRLSELGFLGLEDGRISVGRWGLSESGFPGLKDLQDFGGDLAGLD